MKQLFPYLLFLTWISSSCGDLLPAPDSKQDPSSTTSTVNFKPIQVKYPDVLRDSSVSDNYHGKEVFDPYRWLEDDNSPETKQWVKDQNKATFGYLDKIPFRNDIEKRLQKIWNYEKFSTPFKEGDSYYYFKNDGLQNQSVMYGQKTLDGPAEVILDPNKFSEDGTTSLGGISFSKNGQFLAYQVSEGGSDWQTAYVKNLSNGKILDDKMEWIKFSGLSWVKDGFYYSRYPEPKNDDKLSGKNEFQEVYYHKLGTNQKDDQLVFADRTHPSRGFYTGTTEDERFLVISGWESTSGNALYFKDLNQPNSDFVTLVDNFKNDYSLVDNINNRLLILTNYKADNNRLIAISAAQPEEAYWEEIIPEGKDKLQSVKLIGGKIIATFIHNASSAVKVYDLEGKFEYEVELPAIGTVGGFSGKKSESEAFYSFTSFTRPNTIYSFDIKNKASEIFKAPAVDFNSDDYVTEQVWYESYDKEKIPMFITYKKGLKKDGTNPTLLYGYGGFDISILPSFGITRTIILENGGIYAVANIRGGGEFGKKWHKAGTLKNKQNVFNDFQAAAEYLIGQKYTSSEKLAIEGRSNGGLLVGACMTQRPDLYKVAFPGVGVLDMLRYDKFTIGRAWATDYGLSENPEDFDYLMAYSPLHNVNPGKYPATMITTADHDDRVVPAHSFKFGSELQAQQKGDNPVLVRVETSAGHGAGKPTSKQIAEAADLLSFMFYNMEEVINYELLD